MKTFLKFAGCIALILTAVAFILLFATNAFVGEGKWSGADYAIKGTAALFGNDDVKSCWAGILAFILLVVAIIALICAIVLPLAKVKSADKFAGFLNVCAAISLILAGIFVFCTKDAFFKANDGNGVIQALVTYKISAGWIIAGILSIVSGCIALAPAAADLFSK